MVTDRLRGSHGSTKKLWRSYKLLKRSVVGCAAAKLRRLLNMRDLQGSVRYGERSAQFVNSLYHDLLHRPATPEELLHWTTQLKVCSPEAVYFSFVGSDEFHNLHPSVPLFVPPGHYYSPIVDPAQIADRIDLVFAADRELPGIDLRVNQQLELLGKLSAVYPRLPFTDRKQNHLRYYYDNQSFGAGDAIMLACMIMVARPRQIVEVGSGYSSAVILDIVERELDGFTSCGFVEPYPELLRSLLKPGDADRFQLFPTFIQLVELSIFDRLHANDILFIDSTHIVKTDSDVVHHITRVLPRLRPGVLIHFHDIFFPFEYPQSWVMQNNQSWNELYYLQAFLTNNHEYEILLFNDFLGKNCRDALGEAMPDTLKNPGGSLWLRKR